MIKNILSITLLLIWSCLGITPIASAQVHVNENLDVGVGTNDITTSKLKVQAESTANRIGLEIVNMSSYNFTKYGIHTTVDSIGGGKKVGVYTTLQQSSSSTFGATGIDSRVRPFGGGTITGMYNRVYSGGTGRRYGIQNLSGMGDDEGYGIYSRLTTGGDDYAYGISSQVDASGTGRKTGIFCEVYQNENATDYTNGLDLRIQAKGARDINGQYNFLRYSDLNNNASMKAIYTILQGAGDEDHYGIYNIMSSNSANPPTGRQYGIYNSFPFNHPASGNLYGVYSNMGNNDGYAGYFSGDVHVTGTFSNMSDEVLKENIVVLEDVLSKLALIQPKKYTYKATDLQLGLPVGEQYGFLAQELQTVFPELVRDVTHPGNPIITPITDEEPLEGNEEPHTYYQATKEASQDFKAINYIALIPILVQGINEQQAQITAQQAQIDELKRLVDILIEEGGN